MLEKKSVPSAPTNGNDSCEAAGKSPSSSQAVHGQSKEAKAAQPPPERRGFSWTESDYEAMVSGLRAGQSLYKISKALERTGGAVLSRVEHLLPDPIPLDIPGDRDAQLEYLRRLLVEDKDYQWFELAQLRAHRDGRIVWTTDDDRRLRDAWDKGQPTLAELAQSFNTRPSFVAKHIVELTEASNKLGIVMAASPAKYTRERPGRDAEGRTVLEVAGRVEGDQLVPAISRAAKSLRN